MVIHPAALTHHWIDLQMPECSRRNGSKLHVMQSAFGVNFMSEQHFLCILGAYHCITKRFCGKAVDMIRVSVGEKVQRWDGRLGDKINVVCKIVNADWVRKNKGIVGSSSWH